MACTRIGSWREKYMMPRFWALCRVRRGAWYPQKASQSPRALWSITAKNTDCSTGPLARPFACLLAPLTRSLAPDCSLRSRPPLRSLIRSLAHFAHSLARGTVNDWMAILSVFFSIFDHSALTNLEELLFRTVLALP